MFSFATSCSSYSSSVAKNVLLVVAVIALTFVFCVIYTWWPVPSGVITRFSQGDLLERLSNTPKIERHSSLLTDEECDYIISLVQDSVKDSGVSNLKGASLPPQYKEDAVIANVRKKISDWVSKPTENFENFFVWKFEPGQSYPLHRDVLTQTQIIADSGERVASVFVYLSTPQGGQLVFPDSKPEEVKITPIKGDGVLLWNMRHTKGKEVVQPYIKHYTTPVVGDAVKWTLTVYVRQRKFQG